MYAAATGSALAMATNASAGVIYSGIQNFTVGPIASVGIARITNGNSVSHFTAKSTFLRNGTGAPLGAGFLLGVGQSCCFYNGVDGFGFIQGRGGLQVLQHSFGSSGSNSTSTAFVPRSLKKLGKGVNVSAATGQFQSVGELKFRSINLSGRAFSTGSWTAGKTAFAAFRFQTTSGKTDFGWVRLLFTESNNGMPNSVTAVDWAYNSGGLPINAGDVATPEPGTAALGLLAAGAAGVIALRRKRKAAA
jgi:hypothetical protein